MSHLLTVALTSVLWVAVGYSCVYSTQGMAAGAINYSSIVGGLDKAFLGTVTETGLVNGLPELLFVLYNMKLAIISVCIMLGGLLERAKMVPRMAVVALWTLLVFVPVSHAVSAGPGALLGDLGVLDYAGELSAHSSPF